MTNSILRVIIKIIITLVVGMVFSALRYDLPPIVLACVPVAIIIGVWRYKPQQNNDNDPKLKK